MNPSSASASASSQLAAPPSAEMPPLYNPTTDMDVEVEDSLLMDHEAPAEKTDTDFFNGEATRGDNRPRAPFIAAVR